jgi:hypothetical protein
VLLMCCCCAADVLLLCCPAAMAAIPTLVHMHSHPREPPRRSPCDPECRRGRR